jgi:hypothetical protein
LEWSEAGAKNTINQAALPAAIIIINAPPYESEQWISKDEGAMTEEFFTEIDVELQESSYLRERALKVHST